MKPRFRIQFLDRIPNGFYLRCMNIEAQRLMNQNPGLWYTPYKPTKKP